MRSIFALVLFLHHVLLANATSQCYMVNGDIATSDFVPCTSNLPAGSNSACCNLGKTPPDICLGSGLCQRMDSPEANFLIYAVGCTDQTGKDAACPQYCPNTAQFYSLNPCYNASKSSWCCNDQSISSCCGVSGGSFSFDLTALGLSGQQSTSNPTETSSSTGASNPTGTTNTGETCTAASCPVGKGAVIGGSVGSFFAGTIVAGLLGRFLAERRLRKQSQAAVPNATVSHATPNTEWRTELPPTTYITVPRPGTVQVGKETPKYEIGGREVFETPE
ncbi:hypothetical protein N431DRAFT_481197 [Stipitochalara longipes BDJ]|nr:hypothetical protein N431DRAFT_481197 [Stipitochalara longipes BDJ]